MEFKKVLLVLFLGIAGYQGIQKLAAYKNAKFIKEVQSTSAAKYQLGTPDNCRGKDRCITAFVAPWCNACQMSKPTFALLDSYLKKNRPEIGFGLVVGAGSKAENEADVLALNPIETFADNSGVIMKNRQVNGFPTWIVSDASGKEIQRRAGGLAISDEAQLKQFMKEFLNL